MYTKLFNSNSTLKEHVYNAKLCRLLYENPKRNTMMVFKKRKKCLYIVLQGTNSVFHWIHNISFFPTKDEGLHFGFKQYANQCKDELVNTIHNKNYHRCINDIDTIYFTAHSLGASAIIILIYQLLKEGLFSNSIDNLNIEIVLFGAPKSGNSYFHQNFEKAMNKYPNIRLYRYNVEYDVIKHYPPIFTYSHICNEITLYDASVAKTDLLYNHSINCYIDCMENTLKN